ncbi:Fc.00g018470.m01.CDS01 [Cosmosporella sp. VM-42]
MLLTGNHRAQAQYARAKWRLMVLLPFWAIQLALTMTMAGLFAWRLGDTMKTYKDEGKKGKAPVIEVVWEVTNIILAFVAALGTFYEIGKYFAEALTPWTMLFTHVIKMTCAIAILALDAVVYAQRHDRHYSLVGLGLDGAFIITACVLVIYSVHCYRRLSMYDDYAHPVNVKPFGYDDVDRDASYSSKVGVPRPSLDKRLSSTSSRLSMASIRRPDPQPVPMKPLERTPSQYSHKRDTQFDAYVARRGSAGMKSDVERAVSGEFGWSGTPGDLQEEIARRESITNTGTVPARPRGASMPRAPSWASDRGLVAVPEEDDEPDKDKEARDREALLADSRRASVDRNSLGNHSIGHHSVEQPPVPQEADVAELKWQRG